MKKTIICVAGRNSAGKSEIVRRLAKKLNLNVVQSYCTRSPRKEEIENGLENSDHIFISDAEFDQLKDIATQTEINGARYCTTMDMLQRSDFYVIDPIGIKTLKEKVGDKVHIVQFYVYADENIRKQRFISRGESESAFISRNISEDKQFSEYENSHEYDIIIYNNDDIDYAVGVMESYISLILEDRIKEANESPETLSDTLDIQSGDKPANISVDETTAETSTNDESPSDNTSESTNNSRVEEDDEFIFVD